MSAVRLRYSINVNLPPEYVRLIDQGLGPSQILSKMGFKGRADVVRHAVYKFLVENGIQPSLDPSEIHAPRSRRRRDPWTETEFYRMLTQRR